MERDLIRLERDLAAGRAHRSHAVHGQSDQGDGGSEDEQAVGVVLEEAGRHQGCDEAAEAEEQVDGIEYGRALQPRHTDVAGQGEGGGHQGAATGAEQQHESGDAAIAAGQPQTKKSHGDYSEREQHAQLLALEVHRGPAQKDPIINPIAWAIPMLPFCLGDNPIFLDNSGRMVPEHGGDHAIGEGCLGCQR
ncbi:MAG: hypothetical protein QM757_05660 [Paludibaculum sp.]